MIVIGDFSRFSQHSHHSLLPLILAASFCFILLPSGDALQKFISNFDSRESSALSKPALTAYAVLIFIGSCVSMISSRVHSCRWSVPLCFLKTLDKLGFTSILSLLPLLYLLLFQAPPALYHALTRSHCRPHSPTRCQVAHLASNGAAPSSAFSPGVSGSTGIFVSLPIVVFAYSSQQGICLLGRSRFTTCNASCNAMASALFPIYADLRGKFDLPDCNRNAAPVASNPESLQQHCDSSSRQATEFHRHQIGPSHGAEDHEAISAQADSIAKPTCCSTASADTAAPDAAHSVYHEIPLQEFTVESNLTPAAEAARAQSSLLHLSDMRLIVRVTMVSVKLCRFHLSSSHFQVVTSLCYILCAALGYSSFPVSVDGNILKSYPPSVANDVLVLSMAASIILSYPGICIACALFLLYVIKQPFYTL
jgi:hypothetical protein